MPTAAEEWLAWLDAHGRSPEAYVLDKLANHRVVLLGEFHWIRHDVALVEDLVPSLPDAGVTLLGTEFVDASLQPELDALMASESWDVDAATNLHLGSRWPYQQYLDVMQAVWNTHGQVRMVAMGPPRDFREKGINPDEFMADRLLDAVFDTPDSRALVHLGSHHAFSRMLQPEPRKADGRVHRLMDRAGMWLRIGLGEELFQITLHHWWTRDDGEERVHILPVDGSIDCAASTLGRPLGFDIVGSPFAELRPEQGTRYAGGHPDLRLLDMSDGWIWRRPLPEYEGVDLISLDERLPTQASREAAAAQLDGTPEELEAWWVERSDELANYAARLGLDALVDPCGSP